MATPLERTDRPICHAVNGIGDPATDGWSDARRAYFRSLSEMQKEAVVTGASGGTAWRLASDEGEYLDGADVAPPPLGYVLAGMVGAYANEVRSLADRRGISTSDLEVVLDNYYSMSGSVLQGTMTAGAMAPELEVDVGVDADDETLAGLVRAAVDASPVTGLLRERLPSRFSLAVNAEPVAPDGVGKIDGPAAADPAGRFDGFAPSGDEPETPIVRHTGELTEPLAEADDRYTERGDSTMADEHDRVVHLRGICTPREDGTLHVRQKTYSPRASMFEFVVDGFGAAGPRRTR